MTGRRRAAVAVAIAAVLIATVVADHRRHGDDRARYDHRAFAATAAVAGDVVRLDDGTDVRLLGVADPTPAAIRWLAAQVEGRRLTLLLPPVGVRDADGRLAAYVFTADDTVCLNAAAVRDGVAYADRRSADAMSGLLDAAEADARRKKRGLWAGLTFEQMPAWRQAWLRTRPASTH